MTSTGLALPIRRTAPAAEAVERYFAAFLAVFLALALTRFSPLEPRVTASLDVGMRGDVIKQVGYVALFVAALLPAIIYRPGRVMSAVPAAFLIFFAWCAVTLLWSPVPDIAMRRLTLTFIIVATLFIVAANLSPQRSLAITTKTLNALILLSLVACVALPALAIHQPGDPEKGIIGDWRGVFYHKNIFGSVAAIAVLLNLFSALQNRRLASWTLLTSALFALWMSGSKTSLGVGLLAATIMLAVQWAHGSQYRAIWAKAALATAPLSIAGAVWWFTGPGIQWLSDPELLTGRGRIWQMMAQLIAEHPLGGVGYQSVFQTGVDGVMTDLTANPFFQTLAHAHNGYVEIAVSTGLVGLGLLLCALITSIFGPLRGLTATRFVEAPVLVGIVVFAMVQALTESGLADRDRPVWMLLVLALGVLRSMERGPAGPRQKR